MGGFVLQQKNCLVFPIVFGEKNEDSEDDKRVQMKPEQFDFRTHNRITGIITVEGKIADEVPKRTISKDEILDRSKGDYLAKALVLMQLIWFAIQVIARAAQHLHISALEITTIAYIVVSFILYFIWWHKPKDIRFPICISLSDEKETLEIQKLTRNGYHQDTFGRIFDFIIAASDDLHYELTSSTHLPTFFTGYIGRNNKPVNIALAAELALGCIFGAVHCIAWSFQFPTHAELLFWRTAAVAVTGVPLLLGFSLLGAEALNDKGLGFLQGIMVFLFVFAMFVGGLVYVIARLILLALAFTSLRDLPRDALLVVQWTSFIPHFD